MLEILLRKVILNHDSVLDPFNFTEFSNNLKSISNIMASDAVVSSIKVMNQDLVKLDRFDGTNYTRWQDKMTFLLTALKVHYVLDPDL